jgi:putative transposase
MPWRLGRVSNPQWAFIEMVMHRSLSFGAICRRHGISRQTGYKWWRRFKRFGRAGLRERSRRPHRLAGQWPRWCHQVVQALRRRRRSWGAKKLCWALRQRFPRRRLPCPRTLERWLPPRVTVARRRRGPVLVAMVRRRADRPNAVWTLDFKGWFRTADGTRIEPLTVRDLHSRYVLLVRHLAGTSDRQGREALAGVFRQSGLPGCIRTDNGPPFGGNGALGLSTLSVWLLRLGVQIEFTRPAQPQDNGAHEQMHRVLKAETARPPAATAAAQHQRFQRWRRVYNQERPHEALGMRVPADLYRPSSRALPSRLPEWGYPRALPRRRVSSGGWIGWRGRRRLIGRAFAGERIALRPLGPMHAVWLGPHLLGHLHPDDPGGLRPARRQTPGN